jgi:ABC-2 type transport system ATP-binding protein
LIQSELALDTQKEPRMALTFAPTAPAPTASTSDLAIETRDLSKHYDKHIAVDHLNLEVRQGEVYGFLGPNGAGKTTTLRMLLGLIQPTSGSATVAGGEPGSAESLDTVGAMIEQPGFYPYMSGAANLRLLASYARVDPSRVETVLRMVDLDKRGDDKFSTYSQGMKQRLGLAAALLKGPAVLILDEPSNGLDPAGMAEMRVLIRALADEGRTVLLSSHLLGEIEQICDRIGVIQKGRLVAEGTVDDLRGRESLSITALPLDAARAYLAERPDAELLGVSGASIQVKTDRSRTADITRGLVHAGFDVTELSWRRQSLEDVFLGLTNEREAA